MQSNQKVLQSLIQKVQSPLQQIKNRAIQTLYTKVSARIITDQDLVRCKQLPGALFSYINDTVPTNKDCLFKVLSVLHRYILSDDGVRLLFEYEALQFFQELRKFLLGNQTCVDEHVDLIKKIIKQLLPLQSTRVKEKGQAQNQEQFQQNTSKLLQQQAQDSDHQDQTVSKVSQMSKIQKTKKQQSRQRNILTFHVPVTQLPKPIDQQLYSLMVQLKHGKRQTVLETLVKIQDIVDFWGGRYFKYKEDLVKELNVVVQGRQWSQLAIRIIAKIFKQLIELENQAGIETEGQLNRFKRNYLRTSRVSAKNLNIQTQKVQIQMNFQMFQSNPFSYQIIQTLTTSNPWPCISGSCIEFLLIAAQKYPFSSSFLLNFLQKVTNNSQWVTQTLHKNKFYQEELFRMINHCCSLKGNIHQQIIPLLSKLFPQWDSQKLSVKLPNLTAQLQQEEIQQSFNSLTVYFQNSRSQQNFDFNIELHQLQSHIKRLQKGIIGLPKKPEIVQLYIDCLFTLAISVAKQDPLMSFYPKIKSIILKIAQHQFLNCRVALFDFLLMAFTSSQKINYLAQSYLKSQVIRLVFTDPQFYSTLFNCALNQFQTMGSFLEMTKIIQSTTKEDNRKYLNKFAPIFYILSCHSESKLSKVQQNIATNYPAIISSASKIILSRIPKKYQAVNILLSIFSKSQQQRKKTYSSILGLSQTDDILKYILEHCRQPQKKTLKYSLSTIRNYMNIIMNQKIENTIKSSAIEQMIECVSRIDLSELQKDSQLLQQILTIHGSVLQYIKNYVERQSKEQSSQIGFFLQLVQIYSVLERRLRVNTNHLNQNIKILPPQFYLNVLINICGAIPEQGLAKNQKLVSVIGQFMALIYYHVIKTWTSQVIKKEILSQVKSKSIKVHWIVGLFDHERLINLEVQPVQAIAKRTELQSSLSNSTNQSQQIDKLVQTFIKGTKLKIKQVRQLISQYIQSLTPSSNDQKSLQQSLCAILQSQLSSSIHSIASNQSQIVFLSFIIQAVSSHYSKFYQSTPQTSNPKLLQPLQQIIPHMFNQLIKPNIPQFIKITLIKVCRQVGWKKTKQFQSLIQQLSPQELYYCKLYNSEHKLSVQQLSAIIKHVLSGQLTDLKLAYLAQLYRILLKPAHLKTLIYSATQYTQLLVLNSIFKLIQGQGCNDEKVANLASILLYNLINQAYRKIKSLKCNLLSQPQKNYDAQTLKAINFGKITLSLEITATLLIFVLKLFEQSKKSFSSQNLPNFTLENLCFLLQSIKVTFLISQLTLELDIIQSISSHENKLIKLVIIAISQFLKINPQLSSYSSMEMFYTTFFNFLNCLAKTSNYQQIQEQFDFLDLALGMMSDKIKFAQKQYLQKINAKISQTHLLFSAILQYTYLRISLSPTQTSHYLLSSTSLLECSLSLIIFQNSSSNLQFYKLLLENVGKILNSMLIHSQDYFVLKLNQLMRQEQFVGVNLVQKIGLKVKEAGQSLLLWFMRLLLVWKGQSTTKNNQNNQNGLVIDLNSSEIFGQDDQEEDDSSLQERQLFQKPKNPFQNNWIYKVIDFAFERKAIKHCKTLIALSLPAKLFLLQKPYFMQYLKKMSALIDKKIIYLSTSGQKKGKKPAVNSNSSVLLSQSRRTVMSQNVSLVNEDQLTSKNISEQQKLQEIQDFIKLLISLFIVHENLNSEKHGSLLNKFIGMLSKSKDVLRKIFYNVDKLYTLSELLAAGLIPNKEFGQNFLKVVNALSQSSIFSQALSNHLTQVVSPMLEQSISTILKGLSQPVTPATDTEKQKQALKLLSTLSNHESVRSYIYKNKLIEELNLKIVKYQQRKSDKGQFLNLGSMYDVVTFYLTLSTYKDSHQKLLNDKKVLEILINQVYMQKSSLLSQKILQLLSNLSAYKLNKAVFMQNRQIHKTILGQLQSGEIEYKCHLLTLIHAPAVKLYKRKDVVEMLNAIDWDKLENWQDVKEIHNAVMQVLENQYDVPDKI